MIPPQNEIEARLARFDATNDASVLWPGIGARAFHAAQEEIARVTTAVLADAGSPVRLASKSGAEHRVLGVAAFTSSMGPLLGFWCETGRIVAEPGIRDMLALQLEHGRRRSARMRSQLERLALAFAEHSIGVTVLKGMHTAFGYFPDPGTRPMADIDLLIRPQDLDGACATLLVHGYERHPMGHWMPPGVARRPRSLDLVSAEDPWSVDLHVSLDREFYPGLTAGFGRPHPSHQLRWSEIAGAAHVLAGPLLLGYLAFHAASHFYTMPLVRLVELVLVSRRDFAGRPQAWSELEALITLTATARFVHPSLELAERLSPGTVDPALREHLAAATPRRLRRIVARTTPGSVQRIYSQPFGDRYLPVGSLREGVAALIHLLWPRDWKGQRSPRAVLENYRKRIVRVAWRMGRPWRRG